MAINTTTSFRPDQENVAYIGAGVTLKGEISVPDLVVVDGTIEGDITARVVCVGQTGVIRGNISATEADISGSITDNIEIKQLLIVRASGRVEGKVLYGEIELEKGAVVTGDLSATDDYRAVSKPAAQKAGATHERALGNGAALSKSSNASVERINEAVRNAKSGAAIKSASIYLASSADGSKRPAARASVAGRNKASA
jgi:cytoskeletal protein CcmA (bactofilin family)